MEHPGHDFRFRGKTSNRAEFPCLSAGEKFNGLLDQLDRVLAAHQGEQQPP